MADDVGEISERIAAFVAAQPDGTPAPRIGGIARIGVGRSRENWLFDATWPDGTVEPLIVRRDPPGGLLETDRATEFAVLRSLVDTAVPAPIPRWLDATGEHLGRPSLVMRRAPGTCDYFVLNGDAPLGRRVALARRFCDLLATIHAVDWRAAGLGAVLADPGRDTSPARAELDAWAAVLRRDRLEPTPELDLALAWLRDTAPAAADTVLVHGDFKAGNALLEPDPAAPCERIVALLDWELAHLGDPMEDLGWITQPLRTREHLIDGAWEREDLFAHYEQASGRPVDRDAVRWWNVFASFKTAVMQTSGLRSFVEGRCDELYRPTAPVLRALLDAAAA